MTRWRIAADTGGTFTDAVGLAPDGTLHRAKVLSHSALRGRLREQRSRTRWRVAVEWRLPTDFIAGFQFQCGATSARVRSYRPDSGELELELLGAAALVPGAVFEVRSPEEAPVLAARVLTGVPHGSPLPPIDLRLGTTRGTNALLENAGDAVAFFVTAGFGDLLAIGDQRRPDLFALEIRKPAPLPLRVVGIPERMDARGEVLEPFDWEQVRAGAEAALADGCTVAAVALLHSHANPAHERALSGRLRELGFGYVACSAELSRRIKILPRAEVAVVDATLGPLMRDYFDRVEGALRGGELQIMTSAGGLVPRARFRPFQSLLSGPAGGVAGAAAIARRAGVPDVIAFDMGGTSTDVSRIAESFDYRDEHIVGRARLAAPALRIETVAAGGGSICGVRDGRIHVGPESAGADPGPACYGAGGPLTITDVNLLLGRLIPRNFSIPVEAGAARARLEVCREALPARDRPVADALLEGFLEIANERMADAIRAISVREGYDPSRYALLSFGGAGGLHACALARRLGIRQILVPGDAGLLSAIGLASAAVEALRERQLLWNWQDCASGCLDALVRELKKEALSRLERDGYRRNDLHVRETVVQVRLAGQESALELPYRSEEALSTDFADRYEEVFGYRPAGKPIEIVSLRAIAATRRPEEESERFPDAQEMAESSGATQPCRVDGAWIDIPVYDRASLSPGVGVSGPALLVDPYSTFYLCPNTDAVQGTRGTLRVSLGAGREPDGEGGAPARAGHEAIQRELFTHRFFAVVREMGMQLRRTALSTNIKERMDFSCALLDRDGRLLVNAPHIPVHLGALGLCVRRVMEVCKPEPGDVLITNHPGYGGSHLPDITVITPVFDEESELLAFVANRAHHAEIGGIRPGSMCPEARCLAGEGVAIPPRRLFERGRDRYRELEALLRSGPHPSRAVEDNLADIRAQVAANIRGANALRRMTGAFGRDTVTGQLNAIAARGREALSRRLRDEPARTLRAVECLDSGAEIAVAIDLAPDGVRIDFSGTSAVQPDNLNATEAIVRSAVMYVLRLYIGGALPLNEGLLDDVAVALPECMLNPAFPGDARRAPGIAGGNVETSQRLVDTLLKALDLAACSQGTMNNLVFGDDAFSYYETICGGTGAGPGFAGADAVHTHMTNTAITDPEVLEFRYPVRLRRFAIRRGSGGRGAWAGGCGAVREIEFLRPLAVSLLTQHRQTGPYGKQGGGAGAPGRQILQRSNGRTEMLESSASFQVAAGDVLRIETPGGGGWGRGARCCNRSG